VVSAFDVSCLPLVVLTDVDDGSTFGDVIDGHGCFFIHGPSVGTHLRSMHPCRGVRRETAQPHRPYRRAPTATGLPSVPRGLLPLGKPCENDRTVVLALADHGCRE